jgi:WD40 repeat protein
MVTSYPEGKVLQEFDAGLARPTPATRGNYLLLRPITKYPVGVLNLESKKIFMANRQSALDLYEKLYVSERTDGVLFLFHADSETPLGRAELPQTPLARLRAVAVSPDLNWLAVSESSRGAVWDLREGKRAMLTRGFRGAQFSADNVLYADFPKQEDEERMIARINPVLRHVSPAASLKDSEAHQDGRFLVELHESGGRERSGKNQVPTLIVSDATTGQQIWFRPYPKGLPWEFFNPRDNRAVLGWSANSDFVKEESKTDPELKRRIESKKERQDDYYLHVVEATTGHLLGKVYVETGMGSFRLRAAFATGDYVALYDTSNRLLLYSISTGKQIGRIFGAGADISTTASLLAAENERGVITFYKLPSLEKCAQLSFSSTISLAQFSADGRRFLVVTSDQVAYLIDVTAKELLAASND